MYAESRNRVSNTYRQTPRETSLSADIYSDALSFFVRSND